MDIKPKHVRGKISSADFKKMVALSPRITPQVHQNMRMFFVEGIKYDDITGSSRQALFRRADYYLKRLIKLGVVNA